MALTVSRQGNAVILSTGKGQIRMKPSQAILLSRLLRRHADDAMAFSSGGGVGRELSKLLRKIEQTTKPKGAPP